MNKRKVLNDPVHGFITIPYDFLFDILEHPYFQRLRRIRQLGLTDYVYPGALHTRFHHALGAMHLMHKAIYTLKQKKVKITKQEEKGALAAVLLHDIGHGPFSHTLENCLIKGVSHEWLSALYMDKLNEELDGKLDIAIQIFKNQYPKKFLYQLVAGQLDVDRLDYLTRDSFFTGVSEGVVNYNRIIDMINVKDGELVVEAKAIYSVEKFLISRRIMYWQVYLHKTVVCAEEMLIHILQRAKDLSINGKNLFGSRALQYFLKNDVKKEDFAEDNEALVHFSSLDDFDIWAAIKEWRHNQDKILAFLCQSLIERRLFKIKVLDEAPNEQKVVALKQEYQTKMNLTSEEVDYLVFSNKMTNYLYHPKQAKINILQKDGNVKDIAESSDQWNKAALSHSVSKYYVCCPKEN